MYAILVFFHVASAMGLAGALAVEGVSIRKLARAASFEEARSWIGLWVVLMAIGIPSTLVILGTGIYLASASGVWREGWVALAIPTVVLVAVAGTLLAGRRKRIQAAVAAGAGPLPEAARALLRDGFFLASWRFRAALLAVLVLEMTTRPEWPAAIWEVAIAAAVGVVWGAVRLSPVRT